MSFSLLYFNLVARGRSVNGFTTELVGLVNKLVGGILKKAVELLLFSLFLSNQFIYQSLKICLISGFLFCRMNYFILQLFCFEIVWLGIKKILAILFHLFFQSFSDNLSVLYNVKIGFQVEGNPYSR